MIYNTCNDMHAEQGSVRYVCLVELAFKPIDFSIGSTDGESLGVLIWGGDHCTLSQRKTLQLVQSYSEYKVTGESTTVHFKGETHELHIVQTRTSTSQGRNKWSRLIYRLIAFNSTCICIWKREIFTISWELHNHKYLSSKPLSANIGVSLLML